MGPFLCPFLMGSKASPGGVGEKEKGAGPPWAKLPRAGLSWGTE